MLSAGDMSRSERAAMVKLLAQLGPEAPTLCEGWNTNDLAAHLVARERRPDTAPGFLMKPFARHSENIRESYSQRQYEEVLALLRAGPPKWSPFGLPRLEAEFNTAEFFVHHEDVRRAQEGWTPRSLSRAQQDELWRSLAVRARVAFRKAPCGVMLQRSDIAAVETGGNTALTAKSGRPMAVVTGEPQELLLFAYGRRAHANVKISGPPQARAMLETLALDD